MALSMKNTFISLTLSGVMLFAGFLAGEQPTTIDALIANQEQQTTNQALSSLEHSKKAKRSFTTPYFSFKKISLPVRVR